MDSLKLRHAHQAYTFASCAFLCHSTSQLALNRCSDKIVRTWQYALDDDDIFCNVGSVGYMRPTRGEHGNAEWRTAEGHLWLNLGMLTVELSTHCRTVYCASLSQTWTR